MQAGPLGPPWLLPSQFECDSVFSQVQNCLAESQVAPPFYLNFAPSLHTPADTTELTNLIG